MKRLYILGLTLVLSASFTACDDMGFLQIKPESLVLTDDGVKTPADLDVLMKGAYQRFRQGGFMSGASFRGLDFLADDGMRDNLNFEWTQIAIHDMNLFNVVGRDMWSQTYETINRANQAADSDLADPILATDEAKAKELRADAAYIRALGYFHLVRAFGLPYDATTKDVPAMGVPLRLRGIVDRGGAADAVQRSTVEQVYGQIITDLEFAIGNLPTSRLWNGGRATVDAAKALLAKVYFHKKDYANAAIYAGQVLGNTAYGLDANLKAKYSYAEHGTSTKEVIFMIPAPDVTEDSWGGLRSYRTNGTSLPGDRPSDQLIAAYDQANDARFAAFYMQSGNKWYTTRFDYEFMGAIIADVAELTLIYAESLAESEATVNNAVIQLNKIEARAYGAAVTALTASKATVLAAIHKEQRLECALIGERKHQLTRLKMDVRGDAWDSRKLLFQIPDLEQSGNPGINKN